MKAIDALLFIVALPVFLIVVMALGLVFLCAALVGGLTMTARAACSRRVWKCSWCGHYFTVGNRPRLVRPVGHFEGHGMCRECAKVFMKGEMVA